MPSTRKSFTMIEMIAMLGIIAVLSAIVVSTYRSSQNRYILESDIQGLVSNVRRVQSYGLAAQQIGCAATKVYDYGVYFPPLVSSLTGEDNPYYLIFADCNNDRTYEASSDYLIERVLFDSRDSIFCQFEEGAPPVPNCATLTITIKPPDQFFQIHYGAGDLLVLLDDIDIDFAFSANLTGIVKILKGGYVSGKIN